MVRTGFIDHIGLAVPDLAEARSYYDELMPILGMKQWFPTAPEFNYGPNGTLGTQLFFYEAREAATYSRHAVGLQHIGFAVASRAIVREAHDWAGSKDPACILEAPQNFPQYGTHYATYWLDPHGFKLEAVCHIEENV
ncbi:VOC family protein [Pseudoruegeria sp. HB172150]|uniref:VOC family protein n=1 Tax=Pseudoruegeria sp. HB172150 TaxID=2721164 RepID=UPI0015533A52|nr:VOC family protein [Pseudoruegeria sp. HB172150]